MNNKKIKTEYIVLVVVIVVLSLYLLFQKSDKVQYDIPKLDALAGSEILKIEISGKDSNILITKKDDKWVLGDKAYPADQDKVKKILDKVTGLSLTELVSESRAYNRYGLDGEKKIGVKAYADQDRLLREFEIGNNTSTYGHTYVKIAGDHRVYHAAESFRNDFEKEIDELRDKKVMSFDKEEISEIEISAEGAQYHFTKNVKKNEPGAAEGKEGETAPPPSPTEEISWATTDGKVGVKSKLDSFISQLSNLNCDKFIEDKTPADFQDPIFFIGMKGNKQYTLAVYKQLEKDADKYPAVSSESPYPFLISKYKAENFTKDAAEIIEKKEDPKKSE